VVVGVVNRELLGEARVRVPEGEAEVDLLPGDGEGDRFYFSEDLELEPEGPIKNRVLVR
jgi:hypothetical protein